MRSREAHFPLYFQTKLSYMTKKTVSKIAIGAIVFGAITMYVSSIPYTQEYSKTLETIGSIPFYGGIGTLLGLFLSRIGK